MDPKLNKTLKKSIRRVGMVIKLKPENLEQYLALHAETNPGVRDLLIKYHLDNFSIFIQKIGNEWFEFGYYEYTGNDYEKDLLLLSNEARNKEWLSLCDPLQESIEGEIGWCIMKQIYYNG